ncbi:MAG: MgtC/SapB family protein [Anaerolineaceae bacterium]|nr:MgtC/SapB family protein [Anaerolineaceae bacterium]
MTNQRTSSGLAARRIILTLAGLIVVIVVLLWPYNGSLGTFDDIQSYMILAGRLLLALVLSATIGIERERHDKPAGVRTVAMVGTGSCLFGLLAVAVFTGGSDAASRIVQGVIAGIGFLGAGTIIKEQFRVEGLTTAATIWAAAGVGLAAGLGAYALAVMAAVAVLFILFVLRLIEKRLPGAAGKPPQIPED